MPETKPVKPSMTSRRGGWWGIAFAVTLFVAGAMVSLPSARRTGRAIADFYAAHTGVILVQQVLRVVTLAFFLAFVLTLFGVAALDALAPIAFLILIVILSVRILMGLSQRMPTSTRYS